MLAMPECKIFDHGVCVGPTGAVRPCCAFMTAGIPNMRWEENWRPRHDRSQHPSFDGRRSPARSAQAVLDAGKEHVHSQFSSVAPRNQPAVGL